MRTIFATDIFGDTSHVRELTSCLRKWGHRPEVISPYAWPKSFADEAAAYAF